MRRPNYRAVCIMSVCLHTVSHIFPFNYLPFLTVGMISAPPLFFLPLMAHILSRSRERIPPGFCGTLRKNWWLVRSDECGRFCQSFFRVSRMKSKNSSLHNESSRKLKKLQLRLKPRGISHHNSLIYDECQTQSAKVLALPQ